MADQTRIPPGIDVTRPNIARVYDAFLRGKDNFAVDREVVELTLRVVPDARDHGLANRAFLRRAVRYLAAEAGVRQFLDIGSGLPTQGNVHEVAQEANPLARVVYIDNDPMVLVHSRALLGNTDTTMVVAADLRRPDDILENRTIRRFIDFDQPIGLLLFSILHHIADAEDPAGVMSRLRSALAPGSHVALTHFHNPGGERPDDAERAAESEKLFNERFGTGRWRTRAEILEYFGDFELLEPGLVPMSDWRPDTGDFCVSAATRHLTLGGVARKM